MSSHRLLRFVLGLMFAFATTTLLAAESITLPIKPVREREAGWSSQAIGEMVFRFFRIPAWHAAGEYQCGVAAALMQGPDATTCAKSCMRCDLRSGLPIELETMLEQYPKRLERHHNAAITQIKAAEGPLAPSPGELRASLAAQRPVLALLGAQHGKPQVVLIVGCRDDGDTLLVLFNDPSFEPQDVLWKNVGATAGPYPGSWWVKYSILRGPLDWDRSISVSAAAEGEVPVTSGGPR